MQNSVRQRCQGRVRRIGINVAFSMQGVQDKRSIHRTQFYYNGRRITLAERALCMVAWGDGGCNGSRRVSLQHASGTSQAACCVTEISCIVTIKVIPF
jgi:hypothetical protein